MRMHAECESAAVATAALVLPSREATGNPVVAFLKSAVVPSQTRTGEGPPQKTAVLSMASHLAPTGFGAAKRLSERLGLQAWPAHLESAGHGVLSLELELPGGHCWPALRAEALLRMLDVLRDHEESRVVPDVQVGERLETACRELERLLSKGQALAAYTEWRSRLGAALPLA